MSSHRAMRFFHYLLCEYTLEAHLDKIYHMMFLTPLGSSSLGLLHTPSPRKGYTNHSSAKYKLRSGIKLHNLNILSDIVYCVALDPSKKTGWADRH